MPKLIFFHIPYIGLTVVYIHAVRARQLESKAQLIRTLYRNRKAARSNSTRRPTYSSCIFKYCSCTHKTILYKINLVLVLAKDIRSLKAGTSL
jgi:hypothetical protein